MKLSKYREAMEKLQRLRRKRFRDSIEPPWTCPFCMKEYMYYETKMDVIFVYCQACKQGELMPQHPTYEPVDYYCFVVDNKFEGTKPVFHFFTMDFETYMFLNTHISLGVLKVDHVIQRGEKHEQTKDKGYSGIQKV